MILRKVTLSNWRALTKFEMRLEDGLNVLQGRNEAGKSSVVEAIDWALFRDITGARLRTEDVRVLIPASDPTARPSVEIELEFPDCRAVLLKILAEDAAKRECRLTIRRDGLADEFFDRTEAQTRLRALFAADGVGSERGSVADGGLLVAHQGESADFLSDGSTAIRSTLGVGNDGQLALTTRLERVRTGVEGLRRRELVQDLEPLAIEAARAGTEASRARENLREATNQRAHFEALTREIEVLRAQIEADEAKLKEIVPREMAAQERLAELGQLLVAQKDADALLSRAQNAEREHRAALESAKKHAENIARLRALQDEAARELAGSEEAVASAKDALERAQRECDDAHTARDAAQREAEDAARCADAWRHYLAVFEAKDLLAAERRGLETLETLGAALREAQKERDAAPKAPTFETLRGWRSAFEALRSLENEAAQTLQLEIRATHALALGWKADGGTLEKTSLEGGQGASFNALGEGVLKIAGVGALRVRSGARGLDELKSQIESARGELQTLLGEWRVDAAALPGAIEEWEKRRAEFETVENRWKEAAAALKNEENRVGSLHQAQERVAERERDYLAAKEACRPFEDFLELGGKKRGEVKIAFDAADAEARELSGRANRARNDAATAAQKLRDAESRFHALKARPDALRAAIAGREAELERVENDGLSPEQRADALDECNQRLARARLELESASAARREMGDGVSAWKLEEARRAATAVSEERDALEKAVVARRRDLFHACEQDAWAEIERLNAVIEAGESEVARHEARLRGIALLDAAIQAERARLSRDLAGPLNEKLGPWLSQLRGKETTLSFDEAGSRIENVLTRDGDSTISLPFGEHSEGLKEQVAFALRLLLATRVASHLPSKRLPVVFDDPFTQSDATRRGGLGEVLVDAAQTLQILFVTCHESPPIDGVGVHLIRLGQWEEAAKAKTARKVEKKAQKVVLQTNETPNGTLALF